LIISQWISLNGRQLPQQPRSLWDRLAPNLPPVLLLCGATHMAICAPDITLLDFWKHQVPRLACGYETDVPPLCRWVAMIEVEHDWIGLAAVDARMCQQVGEHQRAVFDAVAVDPRNLAADVVLAIR
jgi:hypothetical protein